MLRNLGKAEKKLINTYQKEKLKYIQGQIDQIRLRIDNPE